MIFVNSLLNVLTTIVTTIVCCYAVYICCIFYCQSLYFKLIIIIYKHSYKQSMTRAWLTMMKAWLIVMKVWLAAKAWLIFLRGYNYKHIPGQVPSEMGNSVPKGLQDEDDVIIIDDALKTAVSYIPATLYCLQTCNILKLLYWFHV